jgi:predicted  nucleic acid-binding Zn ribbon protein
MNGFLLSSIGRRFIRKYYKDQVIKGEVCPKLEVLKKYHNTGISQENINFLLRKLDETGPIIYPSVKIIPDDFDPEQHIKSKNK